MNYLQKLKCPGCGKAQLEKINASFYCSAVDCIHTDQGFKNSSAGKPILISLDSTDTVFEAGNGVPLVNRTSGRLKGLFRSLYGRLNAISYLNAVEFVKMCEAKEAEPNILIIGSGEVGVGVKELYNSRANILGIDIYDSNTVDIICDGHFLPFADETFDGVWVQAVLEHVVRPDDVVKEIFRVLNCKGYVYAETPFMQQVHEGAFDFTRYTLLGHRYLFRTFTEIKIGAVGGPGEVLAWSLRSFVLSIFRIRALATLIWMVTAIPLKLCDKLADKRAQYDYSSGVFFLGQKSEETITPKELVNLYAGFDK